MKKRHVLAGALACMLTVSATALHPLAAFAQVTPATTAPQTTVSEQDQLKKEEKANQQQAKAEKDKRKALKQQDKAAKAAKKAATAPGTSSVQ